MTVTEIPKRSYWLGAFFMFLAVLSFTAGDATTKYLTKQKHYQIIQLLTVRTSFAIIVTLIFILSFKKIRQNISPFFFYGHTVFWRALWWSLSVIFFGLSFNAADLSSVYVIIFITPIIVFLANMWRGKKYINFISGFVSTVTFIGVFIYSYFFLKGGMNFYNKAFVFSLITSFVYAFYLISTDMLGEKFQNATLYPQISKFSSITKSVNMTLSVFSLGITMLISASCASYYFYDQELNYFSGVDWFFTFCAGFFSAVGVFFGAVAYSFASSGDVAPWENVAPTCSVPFDLWEGETLEPGKLVLAATITAITFVSGVASDEHSKERLLKWMPNPFKIRREPSVNREETIAERNVRLGKDIGVFLLAFALVSAIFSLAYQTVTSPTATAEEKKWAMSVLAAGAAGLVGYLVRKR